jgi:hypothetical protein
LKPLWSVRDKLGRTVMLDEDTWHNHIEVRHGRMRGHHASVAKAVADRYRIMQDVSSPNREIFYRPRTHPDYPGAFVKVCVEFSVGNPLEQALIPSAGIVVTAFLVDRIRPDEVQVWPKRKR